MGRHERKKKGGGTCSITSGRETPLHIFVSHTDLYHIQTWITDSADHQMSHQELL